MDTANYLRTAPSKPLNDSSVGPTYRDMFSLKKRFKEIKSWHFIAGHFNDA